MKKLSRLAALNSILILSLFLTSCKKDFLEVQPFSSVSEATLATKVGINGLLIGAYSLLDDGVGTAGGGVYGSEIMADIASDDGHSGTIPDAILIAWEGYTFDATLRPFADKWKFLYSAIQRSNDVLRLLPKISELTPTEATQIRAEATFLRAYYHLIAAMTWKNIPYVDETIEYNAKNYNVSNMDPVWPKIEADFSFAAANLSSTNADVGRANSWAAKAFLVKSYMFQQKFAEAKPVVTDIIQNGRTTNNLKYALVPIYRDNFASDKKHGAEVVFNVQMSTYDGQASGSNGNFAASYTGPFNSPAISSFGWLQPSFDLANAYQTDPVTGLPLIDTYKSTPIKTDQGIAVTAAFTPHTGTLDSRLDWVLGRRGIPYLDWGIYPGQSWVRDQLSGGPYSLIKHVPTKARAATDKQGRNTNSPLNIIRFANVLLWAAEIEVEIGSLTQAEAYVNIVRTRAANPAGFVKKYKVDSDPSQGFSTVPAANYKVGLYTGQFTLNGKDYARKAVRFERRLELGMERHRLFDLRRYDNGTGYMADIINSYFISEKNVPNYNNSYMSSAFFKKGIHEIYPVPQKEIDLSMQNGAATLKQNPGY